MKKIVADISKKPTGGVRYRLYCQSLDGTFDQAVSHTLLQLITEARPPSDSELEELVAQAESGHYVPIDPELPDWSVNDKNVWLAAPMAAFGCICISNENKGDYSTEGGQPQQFTYEQFRTALMHWREFQEIMLQEGSECVIDRSYEVMFPG